MFDEPLFTLRELADQLALPESTVRYYRDAFLDRIPSVGTGRRRRFPPAAFALLRSVAKGYSARLSRAEGLKRIEGAAPAAEALAAPDIERLRQELKAERALVDRLREAKLKLEQRTADAEGALAEHRGRRSRRTAATWPRCATTTT